MVRHSGSERSELSGIQLQGDKYENMDGPGQLLDRFPASPSSGLRRNDE